MLRRPSSALDRIAILEREFDELRRAHDRAVQERAVEQRVRRSLTEHGARRHQRWQNLAALAGALAGLAALVWQCLQVIGT